MPTGIAEELGEIHEVHRKADSITLTIHASTMLDDIHHGDSITVNNVCLTVVKSGDDFSNTSLMQETLDRSGPGQVEVDSEVNLGRAAAVNQRLGGHIVQGHIDSTDKVISRTPGERWKVVRISLSEQLSEYVVEKGSIVADGTSLTISAVDERFFEVSLVPTTLTDSVIGSIVVGVKVNLEVDVLARCVEKMLER